MSIKQNILIIGILILIFPTLAMGGSVISSLIQGKTPAEAIQILGEQLDIVLSRVDKIETELSQQEATMTETQQIIEAESGRIDGLETTQEVERINQQAEEEQAKIDEVAKKEAFDLMEEICAGYDALYETTPNAHSSKDDPLEGVREYISFFGGEMDKGSYATSSSIYIRIKNQLELAKKNLPQLEILQATCISLREQYDLKYNLIK